jgi:tetratricopeptide (TPR) repeat protein
MGLYINRVGKLEKVAADAENKGQYTESAQTLAQLSTLEPWRKDLNLQIAMAYSKAGDSSEAIKWYTIVEDHGDLDFKSSIELVNNYLQNGEPDSAHGELRDICFNKILTPDQFLEVERLQRKTGDRNSARDTLVFWWENYPDDIRIDYEMALIDLVTTPDTALPKFFQIAQKHPEYSQKLQRLIEINIEPYDKYSSRWIEIGKALNDLQEWDLAELAFLNSIKLDDGHADAWALLGRSRLVQGKDGYPDLVKAQELDSGSVLARYFLALYWREHGQAAVAMKYFNQLAREQPREALWQSELGKTAYMQNDLLSGMEYFQSAVRLAPQNLSYWQNLAEFSLSTGMDIPGIGLKAVNQAILLAPDDPMSNDLMGWQLLTRDDSDNAIKFLRKSIEEDANSARSHLHYAQALRGVGDFISARSELEKAISIDPDGLVGLMARRLLDQLFPQK